MMNQILFIGFEPSIIVNFLNSQFFYEDLLAKFFQFLEIFQLKFNYFYNKSHLFFIFLASILTPYLKFLHTSHAHIFITALIDTFCFSVSIFARVFLTLLSFHHQNHS